MTLRGDRVRIVQQTQVRVADDGSIVAATLDGDVVRGDWTHALPEDAGRPTGLDARGGVVAAAARKGAVAWCEAATGARRHLRAVGADDAEDDDDDACFVVLDGRGEAVVASGRGEWRAWDAATGAERRRGVLAPARVRGLAVGASGTPLAALEAGDAGPPRGVGPYRCFLAALDWARPAVAGVDAGKLAKLEARLAGAKAPDPFAIAASAPADGAAADAKLAKLEARMFSPARKSKSADG